MIMKTSLIFVVGFAALAVAVTVPSNEKEKLNEELDGVSEPIDVTHLTATVESTIPPSDAEQQPAQEPEPVIPARRHHRHHRHHRRNHKRFHHTQSEDETSTVKIPSPNRIRSESNPIELAEKIATLDKEAQDKFVESLELLADENKGTIAADFYLAVLNAIRNGEKTAKKADDESKTTVEHSAEIDNALV